MWSQHLELNSFSFVLHLFRFFCSFLFIHCFYVWCSIHYDYNVNLSISDMKERRRRRAQPNYDTHAKTSSFDRRVVELFFFSFALFAIHGCLLFDECFSWKTIFAFSGGNMSKTMKRCYFYLLFFFSPSSHFLFIFLSFIFIS